MRLIKLEVKMSLAARLWLLDSGSWAPLFLCKSTYGRNEETYTGKRKYQHQKNKAEKLHVVGSKADKTMTLSTPNQTYGKSDRPHKTIRPPKINWHSFWAGALDDIEQAFLSKEAEIRAYLKSVQPFVDKMDTAVRDASKCLRRISFNGWKRISGKEEACPEAASIVEAQNCVLRLKDLNNEVRRQEFDMEGDTHLWQGDSVRLALKVDCWKDMKAFLKEKVSHKSIGVFYGIELEDLPNPIIPLWWMPHLKKKTYLAHFPECTNWKSPSKFLEKALTKRRLPIIGDKVKFNSTAKSDCSEDALEGRVGVLTQVKLQQDFTFFQRKWVYRISAEFPKDSYGWVCLRDYTEVDLVDGCPFMPGQKVRVRRSIPRPSRGWGGINRSSVGSVVTVTGREGCETIAVKFPECKDWIGAACDLEPVLRLEEGEKVQMKLSVDCAEDYGGRMTHEEVGEFKYIEDYDPDWSYSQSAVVKFAGTTRYCDKNDIEPVRYVAPSYDKGFEAGVEGNKSNLVDRFDLFSAAHFLEILSSA
ncbi:uncharacterized protein [Watersipora subatra]|uniref:uncharacterized protein n=1 Tax=Watersipora subatra TaxID=2589382 RepID=UPI00355B6633